MDTVAPVGRGFPTGGLSNKGDDDPSKNPTSGVVRASAGPQSLVCKPSAWYEIWIVVIFASKFFIVVSAQGVTSFSVSRTSYNCSGNMICLGEAHVSSGEYQMGNGMLSLIRGGQNKVGIGYYNKPVKLRNVSTQRPLSFSTSFTFDVRNQQWDGDGLAFVISATNLSKESAKSGCFGIFDDNYSTQFKSVVVEFDSHANTYSPVNDINDNHVSFDFKNITPVAAANALDVTISDETTKYAWVEYSNETLQLEVRLSSNSIRPDSPLLSYTVNLFHFVEDYMWVGFSTSSGWNVQKIFIGDWTFESDHGIPAPSLVPTAPIPTPPSYLFRQSDHGTKLGVVVGISIGIGSCFLACIAITALVVWRACRAEDPVIQLEGMPQRFSYKELSAATGRFSPKSKLGQGGFGSVHRGILPSLGTSVAVKKMGNDCKQGEKEFLAEVSIIGQLSHRNLIHLQGWCKDPIKGKYLLVYELMPNGSLDKVLFPEPAKRKTTCLYWPQRLNIVCGTATALDYLHNGWKQQVIHRDIKSSNIMLDKEWNARLGDFGLARLVDHQREAATTQLAGTLGYFAPEVNPCSKSAFTGKFTDKTDVFAFGVVVLEVACGRKAFLSYVPEDEMFLVDWVRRRFNEGELMSTVDKRLKEYDTSTMERLLKIGLLCSHPDPLARPSMRDVVPVLAGKAPAPSILAFPASPIQATTFGRDA